MIPACLLIAAERCDDDLNAAPHPTFVIEDDYWEQFSLWPWDHGEPVPPRDEMMSVCRDVLARTTVNLWGSSPAVRAWGRPVKDPVPVAQRDRSLRAWLCRFAWWAEIACPCNWMPRFIARRWDVGKLNHWAMSHESANDRLERFKS